MINVLLIGSGGREHAIAYKIKESKNLNQLFISPGNPGSKLLGNNIELNIKDHKSVIDFCIKNKIELVVIGPEQPLAAGLADDLRKNKFKVFGPNSNAAQIESSKSFAKNLMRENNIPTADYKEFSSHQLDDAKNYLTNSKYPIVIKADGLAAGKGVIICENFDKAQKTLNEIFLTKIFGDSGNKIIVEEFLTGKEASIFAITDGEKYVCLPSSQDHKRIGDNDTGKNTGGMGAYSPAPIVTLEILENIKKKIIEPALNALKKADKKFIGCLYCGIILTDDGPKVIEFNCRFGDPETQAVLPLLEGDFLELLFSAANEKLNKTAVKYSGGCAVCVIAASKGYPDNYEKGFEITGIDNNEKDIIIFHAGTTEKEGRILTGGGRVLGVTAVIETNDLKLASQKAYRALSKINFNGIYFRKDIAAKAALI